MYAITVLKILERKKRKNFSLGINAVVRVSHG